jgi:hypothetical protein
MSIIMINLENLLFRLFRTFQRSFLVKKFNLGISTFIFSDYFKGFEKLEVVKAIFGNKTNEILNNLKIDLTWFGGYMFVDDFSGHLVVSSRYLKKGNKVDIYLDLIHELFHVKQFLEGKNLFDTNYSYVDRPTEIEAYTYTIKEARRIGLTDKRILAYLETEWITSEDLRRLAKYLNVNY